ncbi:MAG: succinate dehydrogenase, cytochrome b556 subunit [Alphaproteobacteria bacterium]
MQKSERPLSPHLQIYKWQLTMATSIMHRITGAALAVGSLLVVWWLAAAALGPVAYDTAMKFSASPLGLFMLFGWSAAFYYHLFNGIRHLIWDTVHFFELKNAYIAGYAVLALTALAAAATWYYAHVF